MVGGAKTTDWSGVGALFALDASFGGYFFCTGALIDRDVVLTAGHCVEYAEEFESEGLAIWYLTGNDLTQTYDEAAKVTALHQHPDYDPLYLTHDLGVMTLDHDLDAEVYALNETTVGSSWTGRDLWHVGFGISGWNEDDTGVKREVMLPVAWVEATHIGHEDPGGKNLCLGDSGGPAIDPTSNAIVGVASFVYADKDETLCDEGGSATARVDIDLDWIEETAALGEEDGTGEGGGGGESATGEPSTGAAGQLPSDDAGVSCTAVRAGRGLGWGLLVAMVALVPARSRKSRPSVSSRGWHVP